MNKKLIFLFLFFILLFGNITLAAYTSTYSEPTILIKKGTYGTGVKWLQDMLNHNGYSITIDGAFGNTTYNAVINFQRNNKLDVDGIVGPATRNALKKYANTSIVTSDKYTTTRVNFRSGPSTSNASYGILEPNTRVCVYSSSNGWSYVKYDNTCGYIYTQYLSNNTVSTTITSSNGLSTFTRNTSNLLDIIKNCKSYYANNNFYYSLANGVRTIPADNSTSYSGKYYVDCSSFVTWVLYEYVLANGNTSMQNYFSYQRNSTAFANMGATGGNAYLKVIDKKENENPVDLSLAKPGDILVSNGHVEFFSSYTNPNSNYVNIKVYNCGSNKSIKNPGLTTSATLDKREIKYILRVN